MEANHADEPIGMHNSNQLEIFLITAIYAPYLLILVYIGLHHVNRIRFTHTSERACRH